MAASSVLTHADQHASRIVSIMRSQKTSESCNKVDIAAIFNGKCFRFDVFHILDDADRFGPFNGSTCDFDGAFESILGLVTDPIADCAKKTILR